MDVLLSQVFITYRMSFNSFIRGKIKYLELRFNIDHSDSIYNKAWIESSVLARKTFISFLFERLMFHYVDGNHCLDLDSFSRRRKSKLLQYPILSVFQKFCTLSSAFLERPHFGFAIKSLSRHGQQVIIRAVYSSFDVVLSIAKSRYMVAIG
jgi:hypothetical protein